MHSIMFQNKAALGYQFMEYIKLWAKYRKEPNVLLLHYNDAIRDLKGVVKKLASFYNVDLTNDELETIVKKASFGSMKQVTGKFNYRLWGNPDFHNGMGTCMQEGSLLRKGVTGDSNTVFSKEELAQIKLIQEDYFKDSPELLRWSREGGRLA